MFYTAFEHKQDNAFGAEEIFSLKDRVESSSLCVHILELKQFIWK